MSRLDPRFAKSLWGAEPLYRFRVEWTAAKLGTKWIAERCNADVVAKPAIVCQSCDFRCHLNEATKLGHAAPNCAPTLTPA
jgi:hypothetical protein